MESYTLHKMNGLGNDFLIFDKRKHPKINLTDADILNLSNRTNITTGGCDQFIILKESRKYDIFMQIYNADGGEVDACGNATRCVVSLLQKDVEVNNGASEINIETNAGILSGVASASNYAQIEMTEPDFNWKTIPLSEDVEDILSLPILFDGVHGSAVSMGNPHLVFVLQKPVEDLNLKEIGSYFENHPLYPERTNVSFANVLDEKNIRLRVFERGVGETQACGTGACATHVVAKSLGLVSDETTIHLNGGNLTIFWKKHWNNNGASTVKMKGATEYERDVTITSN